MTNDDNCIKLLADCMRGTEETYAAFTRICNDYTGYTTHF